MKRPAFAYPTVLLTLLLMTLLSLHMLRTHYAVTEVDQIWQQLGQAQLNCASALNHFLHGQSGFSRPSDPQSFSFAPENGFTWRALPFGMFWLMEIEGFSGKHRLRTRMLVGGAPPGGEDEPLLYLREGAEAMRVDGDTLIQGTVRWDQERQDESRIPGALLDKSELGRVPELLGAELADHLAAPFRNAWRKQLREILPALAWHELAGTVDLNDWQLEADLLVLSGTHLILEGEYRGESPLLILDRGQVSVPGGATLTQTWIMARQKFQGRSHLRGSRVHIWSPEIDIAGDLNLEASTLAATGTAGHPHAGLLLRGRGKVEGTLLAVPLAGGRATFEKDRRITTEGLLHCEGNLVGSGRHRGIIRTDQWTYREGTATYPHRLAALDLAPGRPSLSVWGLEGHRGEVVYRWEVK